MTGFKLPDPGEEEEIVREGGIAVFGFPAKRLFVA